MTDEIDVDSDASLVAMVQCFPEEAQGAPSCPKKDGRPKPLREWRLAQLLSVASDLSWLPARVDRDGDFDHKLAAIGDYADVVRQMRNLVHPARYLEDMPGKRITQKYLDMAEEVLEVASDYLYNRLISSIKQELPQDE